MDEFNVLCTYVYLAPIPQFAVAVGFGVRLGWLVGCLVAWLVFVYICILGSWTCRRHA